MQDVNKAMLLKVRLDCLASEAGFFTSRCPQNDAFIPLILDGLLLDAEHPRNDTPEAVKSEVQRDFAECIAQISLFLPGCEALKASSVVAALDSLVEKGWTEEAKDSARAALMQLTDRKPAGVVEIDPEALHIMMSCAHASSLCQFND